MHLGGYRRWVPLFIIFTRILKVSLFRITDSLTIDVKND